MSRSKNGNHFPRDLARQDDNGMISSPHLVRFLLLLLLFPRRLDILSSQAAQKTRREREREELTLHQQATFFHSPQTTAILYSSGSLNLE